ncbi:MAG: hypothetical protein AAF333_13290 [Planctomycetota bacterium]
MSHDPASEADAKLIMPSAEDLATRTIGFLAADGYTSSVMKLPRPLLNELGRRLVEPGAKRSDVIDWLRDEDVDTPDRNLYRFAQRFCEAYKVEWGKAADELLMAERAAAGDFDTVSYERVTRNRAATLLAQKLVTTEAAELDLTDLQRITAVMSAIDHGRIEEAKLGLAERQADDRAAKLQAEVEKLNLDLDQRRREIEQAKAAAEAAKKDVQGKIEAGSNSMDAADVIAILDRVMKGEAA